MTAPRRYTGRGTLVVLALLLASSGAIRFGLGVGEAVANAPDLGSAPLNCPEPPLALAEALNEREARIAAQEAAIADRQSSLALADQAIGTRLAALAEAEASLSRTIALADGAAEKDLAQLTEVYETMKPRDAAPLFEAMAPEFAAGFLGRMRPDAAAAILAGLTSDKGYAISLLLAGRNAGAPVE
jgi:flagellar motility protein MotE (MotC chaperone)